MKKYLLCFLFLFVIVSLQAKEDEVSKFSIKGQKYLDAEEYEKALASFTKALKADSTQPCYWYGYAKAFYHSYRSEGNYVGKYYERAKSYYEKVISYYQKVIKLGSNSSHCVVDAYISLGQLQYHDLYDYLSAMDRYEMAIHLDPTNPLVYSSCADIQQHFFSKSSEFGCVIYKAIIKYRDDSLRADRIIPYTEIARNAIKNYKKAIQFNYADSAYLYFKCGYISYRLKEYKEAIDYYDKSIEINPSYNISYLFRANAKHELLDDVGACEDYKLSYKLIGIPMSEEERKKYCK